MSDLISIVVPVYNVEEFLPECVDSILEQTYSNFELILVDDGATDRCPEICDQYAKEDARVKTYHKQNGGLSDARNYGVEKANGKYITFVDSDDVVSKDYLKLLYDASVQYEADIVQCKFTDEINVLDNQEGTVLEYKKEEAFLQFLLMGQVKISSCAKLYKTNVMKDILFPVGRINEDNCTTYKYLYNASKVVCIPNYLYWYRPRQGSITKSGFSEKKLEILKVPNEIKAYLGEDAITYKEALEYHELQLHLSKIHELLDASNVADFKKEKQEIVEYIRKFDLSNKYLTTKYVLGIKVLQVSEVAYHMMLKILDAIK